MPSKGGAQPYRKGAAHENLVLRAYEQNGWVGVRSPKSASPFDLMCINADEGIQLVQCKLGGYMRPAEREALIDLAASVKARPVLAWGRNPIHRRDLATGGDLEDLANPD